MQVWNIRLFGGLQVSRGEDAFFRFSTRKAGGLLAYLAFYQDRRHTREALCDLLWPDEPPEKSRARLRVALTSLRHQLEPPGVPAGSVIRTEGQDQILLASGAVATDVAQVEQALKVLTATADMEERASAARRIVSVFTHPLLTSFYDNWVIAERARLSQTAIEQLIRLAPQLPLETGIELAQHAARIDPLAEEPLFCLLPLLAENGQQAAAQRTFQAYRQRWEATMGQPLSRELRDLAASLTKISRAPVPTPTALRAPPAPQPLPEAPRTEPPAPLPVRLPTYLTRFFGREAEREAIHRTLSSYRLVTLTGPGGAGKTRLAVEASRDWKGACWFVPLAPVDEVERLPAALCDALSDLLPPRTTPDSPDALLTQAASALASIPRPLLILDNLEQIADNAGSLVLALLERVPTLRILITSRMCLHLPGEEELPVPPLPLPAEEDKPAGDEPDLAQLTHVASIALFLDRARAARPDYQITPRNRTDILAICRLLEGIPLAIELVAARSGTLVPAQMREKLTAPGSLMISARHAEPGHRHHSLYAAIDWSYRLLPASLQRFFAPLSLFRGSFTSAAAAALCDSLGENVAAQALAQLRAHSLVGTVADASEMRFSLLESLRTFGKDQMTEDEQEAAYERHDAWFADVAERFYSADEGPDQTLWLERLEADLPNFRAARERDLTHNPCRALQVAGRIWNYWNLRGRPTEGRAWLERALAACPPEHQAFDDTLNTQRLHQRGRALQGAGALALMQGESVAARPFFEESLSCHRQSGDRVAIASVLNNLGLLAMSRQDWDKAHDLLSESLEIRRTNGAKKDIAASYLNLGVVQWERGDYAAAIPLYEQALALFREQGNRIGEGRALNNLGTNALAFGQFADAESWYAQSLAIKRVLGNPPGIAITLSNVGIAAMYQGRYAVAAAHFEEALALFREMEAADDIANQLRNLGKIATYRQEWDRAYALLAESLTLARQSDVPDDITINLEAFALFAQARGEAEKAAQLLGASDALRIATDTRAYPAERPALDQTADGARQILGNDAFDAAFQKGAILPLEEIVNIALTIFNL